MTQEPHKDMLHVRVARHSQAWTTPEVNDAKNDAGPSQFKRNSQALNVQAAAYPNGSSTTSPQSPEAKNGRSGLKSTPQLNPEFVEALMGLPSGWSRIEDED